MSARSVSLNREISISSVDSVEVYTVARDYTIPDDSTAHILLSEAMSTALEKEPQVAIMSHLLCEAPDAKLFKR